MVAETANLRKCVSLSSAEVKYFALSKAVKTVVQLRNVLTDHYVLAFGAPHIITLFEDGE